MHPTLRRIADRVVASPATGRVVSGVARVERSLRRVGAGSLAVVTYHRIAAAGSTPHLMESVRSTDPDGFVAQIDTLARHHTFVTVDEVLACRRHGRRLPERALLITFDDSYRDLADHAWPVLRERGIPAVLFVATDVIDGGVAYWWDALHHAVTASSRSELPWRSSSVALPPGDRRDVVRRLRDEVKALPHDEAMAAVDELVAASGVTVDPAPVLGWDELRRLHDEGVTLAPHSRSHAYLDRVPHERAVAEIRGSMEDLERQLGSCPPVFAYPSGQQDAGTRRAAAEAGIEIAFTTQRIVNPLPPADWLELGRINVGGATTPALLQAQLLATTGGVVRAIAR